MNRLHFIFYLCVSIYTQASSSSCPLCDSTFIDDQNTLTHINKTCTTADPKLILKSEVLAEKLYKQARKTLDILQNYILGTLYRDKIDVLAPKHMIAQKIAYAKLMAMINEKNIDLSCKEDARELLFEIQSLQSKAQYRKWAESLKT